MAKRILIGNIDELNAIVSVNNPSFYGIHTVHEDILDCQNLNFPLALASYGLLSL